MVPSQTSSGPERISPWVRPGSSGDKEKAWYSPRMGNLNPIPYKIIAIGAVSGEQFTPLSLGESKMSDPTREEYDAKLEAVEARLGTSLVKIDGKLDRLFDRVDESVRTSHRAEDAANAARVAASNVKWNILITALAVVGVMFAAWALWSQGIEMIGTILSVPKP